jgi:cell division septum initiation protein DivIVA
MGGLWYVDPLYGYLAISERQQEADIISRHIQESTQVNSDWKRKEDQMAAEAVRADNARSAEIQARARQAIAEDQRATSDMIVKGYEARSKVYDEISRKRENAILGTVDVVDSNTGKQYKIDNYSDYHLINNQGVIAGTKTDTSPGVDWRQMITLP